MKQVSRLLLILVAMYLAGCGPAEPPPPAAPAKSETELRRVKYFGAAVAADTSVDWRSSGLGVKIITPGTGVSPGFSDKVRVHYTGTLADGTVFDDTRATGKPRVFPVSDVVRGLSEGLGLLRPGGRAIFYIPPVLGYGNMKAGSIPPLSGLTFDVEVLEVILAE
ncbi:MAG TPA: FKBP-type peptidyl-prolyl cis-trans isomerase [Lacunisphaera sp.]|nr:FKBP-type peptidyl-prolyl cis-trans isomerase [Lacunisphaera sp.]